MKSYLRGLLVVAGVAGCVSLAAAGPFFTSLKLYWGQHNWARAAKVGSQAIAEEPNNPEAFYKFGSALAEVDSLERAGFVFQRAVELAKAANDADAVKEAERSRDYYYIQHWNQGIAARSDGSGLLDSLGSKIDTTKADVREVVKRANSQYAKSAEEFTKAALLKPNDPKPWNAKGSAYTLMGRTTEALAAYRKALEIDSTDVPARKNIRAAYAETARSLQSAGKWSEAAALFDTLVVQGDTAVLIDLAVGYYEAGAAAKDTAKKVPAFRKSAQYYERYMAAYPADTTVVHDYALVLVRARHYAQAEQVIKKLINQNPMNPEYHLFLGDVFAGRNPSAAMAERVTYTALNSKGQPQDPAKLKPLASTDAGKVMAKQGRPEKVLAYQDSGFTMSVWFYMARKDIYVFVADKQIGKSGWAAQ
jgi:Flp pilus assembly protein TadD